MIEAGIMGAAVALLNGVRDVWDGKGFKALGLTLSAGLIGLVIGFLLNVGGIHVDTPAVQAIIDSPVLAFILGLGGSGFYTLGKVISGGNSNSVPVAELEA
jgi:hypothetical protein